MLDTKNMEGTTEEIKEEKPKLEQKTKKKKESKKVSGKDYFYLTTKPESAEDLEKDRFIKMILPHAPEGKCETAIRTKTGEVKIYLINGEIYVDPRFDQLVKLMERQDFIKVAD